MLTSVNDNIAAAQSYLVAIEGGASDDELAEFLAPNVVIEEPPNLFTPQWSRRDLAAANEAAKRGRKLVANQRYEIVNVVAGGDRVVMEVNWSGTLTETMPTVKAGTEMRAYFGMFLKFAGSKIVHQRNYVCYEPW